MSNHGGFMMLNPFQAAFKKTLLGLKMAIATCSNVLNSVITFVKIDMTVLRPRSVFVMQN